MPASSCLVRRSPLLWTGLVAAAVLGCQKKDPEKCTEAQQVVRKSVEARDFALANQWREYAYKQCDDRTALASLDQEVVQRQAAIQAEEAALQARKQQNDQLVKLFLDFVAQNRAAPERASAAPVCDPPPPAAAGAPAGQESKDRFCTAVRQVGTNNAIQVRYFEAEPQAFRFTTTPEGPLDCSSVGGSVSKKWEVPAQGGKSAPRWRCDLAGPLAGLTAVVSGASRAELYVVSPTYVSRDPGWKTILEGP
jgi:hypothetical protein